MDSYVIEMVNRTLFSNKVIGVISNKRTFSILESGVV